MRRKAVLRSLIEAGGQISEYGYDEVSETDEVLDRAESLIFQITESSLDRSYFLVNDFLYEHIGSLEELHRDPDKHTLRGFSTGFRELDDLTSGLQRSDLIIVAGRPGTGKTSLALSFARNAAIRDRAALGIFSLEMTKEQLLERLLCGEAKVSLHRLRGGYVPAPKWRDIASAASKFQKSTIVIDDTPGVSVLEIRAKARRMAAQYGLDMIIVDYLQLVDAGIRTDLREQEIAYISRSLKKLARELNVPVVAVSQLSRAVERRESKRPMLSDLRESGALEQDADVVMFIYREDYYAQPGESRGLRRPGRRRRSRDHRVEAASRPARHSQGLLQQGLRQLLSADARRRRPRRLAADSAETRVGPSRLRGLRPPEAARIISLRHTEALEASWRTRRRFATRKSTSGCRSRASRRGSASPTTPRRSLAMSCSSNSPRSAPS